MCSKSIPTPVTDVVFLSGNRSLSARQETSIFLKWGIPLLQISIYLQ